MTSLTQETMEISPAIDRDWPVRAWLWFVVALVFAMIVVGGATRLTDSGLSITEWKPIMGAIPPLSDADWHDAFEKYKQIPEYHVVNKGMSLEAFKGIFWWEWAHRFLGRFIGLAIALPFLVFWATGRLRPGFAKKLGLVLGLVAIQGGIGWYMVSSGLVDRIDVSQYRLALHLSVAFLILAALVWLALSLSPRERPDATKGQRVLAGHLVGFVFVQVVLGAFVAGLKAGMAYNSWPDMNGEMIPSGLFALEPWWRNWFEDITTVQFNHRVAAYLVLAFAVLNLVLLVRAGAHRRVVASAAVVLAAVVGQAAIGIWTLLAVVPLSLGLAHQGGAAVVFALAVHHWWLTSQTRAASERRPAAAS
jgi:cytochrome c oxidase assembly protein subunit 15